MVPAARTSQATEPRPPGSSPRRSNAVVAGRAATLRVRSALRWRRRQRGGVRASADIPSTRVKCVLTCVFGLLTPGARHPGPRRTRKRKQGITVRPYAHVLRVRTDVLDSSAKYTSIQGTFVLPPVRRPVAQPLFGRAGQLDVELSSVAGQPART